jgi:hypothetical protein
MILLESVQQPVYVKVKKRFFALAFLRQESGKNC